MVYGAWKLLLNFRNVCLNHSGTFGGRITPAGDKPVVHLLLLQEDHDMFLLKIRKVSLYYVWLMLKVWLSLDVGVTGTSARRVKLGWLIWSFARRWTLNLRNRRLTAKPNWLSAPAICLLQLTVNALNLGIYVYPRIKFSCSQDVHNFW